MDTLPLVGAGHAVDSSRSDDFACVVESWLRDMAASTLCGRQLFNSIDPSPFRSRDLDPDAEEFIVGWAKDFGRTQQLALEVSIDRAAGLPDEAAVLREAIHEFFRQRALGQRRRLRELLRVGRISLAIGLVVLASAVAVGNFLSSWMKGELGQILREMLVVGGLGFDVAAAGDLPVRLVADSGRSAVVGSAGSDAGADQVWERGWSRGVEGRLAGGGSEWRAGGGGKPALAEPGRGTRC